MCLPVVCWCSSSGVAETYATGYYRSMHKYPIDGWMTFSNNARSKLLLKLITIEIVETKQTIIIILIFMDSLLRACRIHTGLATLIAIRPIAMCVGFAEKLPCCWIWFICLFFCCCLTLNYIFFIHGVVDGGLGGWCRLCQRPISTNKSSV